MDQSLGLSFLAHLPPLVEQLLFPLGVHLLENLELLIRSSQHLIDLSVAREIIADLVLLLISAQQVLQHGFALLGIRFLVEHACFDDLGVQAHLETRSSQDVFFDGIDGYQSKHTHLSRLSDAVGSILCLHIDVWVPTQLLL